MKFLNLEAENFLSIGKLSLPLENQGLLVITGENRDDPSADSNGSGKSAVVESIYWGLYGNTLRGIRYKDDVVNRYSKKNCRVKIELRVKDGMLVVERFRKHKEGKNGLRAFLNGSAIHSTHPRTTQKTLNTLLGMDAEAFARLVLIGQGFAFRYTDMSDRELKEFIEGLTGSVLYAKAHGIVRDKLKELQGRTNDSVARLESIKKDIEEHEDRLAKAVAEAEEAEAARDAVIQSKQRAVDEARKALVALQGELEQIQSEREANLAQYEDQASEWREYISYLLAERQKFDDHGKDVLGKAAEESTEALARMQGEVDAARFAYEDHADRVKNEREAIISELMRENREQYQSVSASHEAKIAPVSVRIAELESYVQSNPIPEPDHALAGHLKTLQIELGNLDATMRDFESKVGSKCPMCGQLVTEESVRAHVSESFNPDARRNELVYGENGIKATEEKLAEHEKLIERHRATVEESWAELGRLRGKLDELQKARDAELSAIQAAMASVTNTSGELKRFDAESKAKSEELKRKIEENRAKMEQVQEDASKVLADLDSSFQSARTEHEQNIQKAHESLQQVFSIRDDYRNGADERIRAKEAEMSTLRMNIEAYERDIETKRAIDFREPVRVVEHLVKDKEKALTELQESVKAYEDEEYVLDYLSKAFGMGGIRSYMIDSILVYLNDRLKAHCAFLFDGRTRIELSPIRQQQNKTVVDKISLVVNTSGGSYDASSGGERRKVDIALFLAFRDLQRSISPVKSSLEAYDEILSFLDGESASRVVQLLVADDTVDTKILMTHRVDVPIPGKHSMLKAVKSTGITQYVKT